MKLRFTGIIFLLLLFRCTVSTASDILIGLFYGEKIEAVVVSVVEGEYIMSDHDQQIATLTEGSIFHFEIEDGKISVVDASHDFGTFESLELKGISSENVFAVRPVSPALEMKESDDDLLLSVDYDRFRIINKLDLEKYVAGTIESEGGTDAPFEYYKAQAVLARTFAVKNFNRHAFEGFNLCDGEHCQVYNGKSRYNDDIVAATLATAGEILVDQEDQVVNAPYHANCGGITSSASMAWNEDLPYLVPVVDPFCLGSKQATWTKSIPLADWNAYLSRKGILSGPLPENVNPEPERIKAFYYANRALPLTEVRQDFQLRSAFFTISLQGNSILLNGRGYGHGVGLCQDGAMEMARKGYVYVDILMFYFYNLKLAQYQPTQ